MLRQHRDYYRLLLRLISFTELARLYDQSRRAPALAQEIQRELDRRLSLASADQIAEEAVQCYQRCSMQESVWN